MPVATLLALAVLAAATPDLARDPLAPARDGLVECGDPDDAKKTCKTMATYQSLGGGLYSTTGVATLPALGGLTVEMTIQVEVRQGAVCGAFQAADVAQAKLFKNGRALSGDEAAPILAQMEQMARPMFGQTLCDTHEAVAGGLVKTRTTINGEPKPAMDSALRWVKPWDGYTLAP